MLKRKSGFTIVEVIVVIAVIGILTTVGVIAYNRYRIDARDAQRKSQLTVLSQALEKYFAQNGEYPGCATMTQSPATISASVLVGIDTSVFVAPGSGLTNSITCGTPSTSDYFGYTGTGASCTSGSVCLTYQLSYKSESTGTVINVSSTSSTSNTAILTSGLVLNMDASTSDSYPGTGTTWTDLVSSTNNGTLTNGPTYSSTGGGSIVFDGVNDGVQLAGTNLSLNTMTISSWNYSTNYTQNGFMFEKTTNGTLNTQYSLFYDGGGNIYYRTYGLSTTDLAVNTASAGVGNNRWNNVVATWDGTNKKIYVNGTLVATSATLTGTVTANNTGAAYIGIYGNFAGYPFNGRIGSTVIYNRALSASEVQQNFEATKSKFGYPTENIVTSDLALNLDAGATASYPGSGTAWYDLSGNRNNATLVGSPTYSNTGGTSIVFNGTTQYATVPMANLRPTSGITQEVWLRASVAGTSIFIGAQYGNISDNSYALWWESSNWRSGVRTNGAFSYGGVTSPTFTANTWYHFAHTYDGANQRMYLNGNLIETRATTGVIQYDVNNTLLAIAADWNSGYNAGASGFLNGKLPVARIYNRALSQAEITQNFQALRSRYGI